MIKVFAAAGALGLVLGMILGGCTVFSSQPAITREQAAQLDIQVQPQADSAFNIVWLRTTLRNRGPGPAWLIGYADTVEAACAASARFGLKGTTPKGESLAVCRRCPPSKSRATHTRLNAGEERVMMLQVDLNRVFPASAIDSAQTNNALNCAAYNNRTKGPYHFYVQYQPLSQGLDQPAFRISSNTVRIFRK